MKDKVTQWTGSLNTCDKPSGIVSPQTTDIKKLHENLKNWRNVQHHQQVTFHYRKSVGLSLSGKKIGYFDFMYFATYDHHFSYTEAVSFVIYSIKSIRWLDLCSFWLMSVSSSFLACNSWLRSAIRWHHPPQRAVLSQICCFGERKMVLFQIPLSVW